MTESVGVTSVTRIVPATISVRVSGGSGGTVWIRQL